MDFIKSKMRSRQSIPVNKSSLTTIDIFQLKILANRQRINVNWNRLCHDGLGRCKVLTKLRTYRDFKDISKDAGPFSITNF